MSLTIGLLLATGSPVHPSRSNQLLKPLGKPGFAFPSGHVTDWLTPIKLPNGVVKRCSTVQPKMKPEELVIDQKCPKVIIYGYPLQAGPLNLSVSVPKTRRSEHP
jgi:hypothetical protein